MIEFLSEWWGFLGLAAMGFVWFALAIGWGDNSGHDAHDR